MNKTIVHCYMAQSSIRKLRQLELTFLKIQNVTIKITA